MGRKEQAHLRYSLKSNSLLQDFLDIKKGGWVQLAEAQVTAALQDMSGQVINKDSHWPWSHMHQSGSVSAPQGYWPVQC